MEIIDCHTHLGRNNIIRASAGELFASMKKSKISKAFVFAGEINAFSNENLIQETALYPNALFPVPAFSNNGPRLDIKIFEELLAKKEIYGLKFYLGYDFIFPSDDILKPYLSLLQKYGKPAIFHSGDTYGKIKSTKLKYAHPLLIDDVAADFPDLPIIIAHLGYPWIIDASEVAYKNPNVFLDTSGLVLGEFDKNSKRFYKKIFLDLFEREVKNKILFGTDWPIAEQKSYLKFIYSLPLTETERKSIFNQNAISIFKI